MKVKTEPSIPGVEEQLSTDTLDQKTYVNAVQRIKREGYVLRNVLLKRRYSKPGFILGAPIKILPDWDPQLHESDMVLLLRRSK